MLTSSHYLLKEDHLKIGLKKNIIRFIIIALTILCCFFIVINQFLDENPSQYIVHLKNNNAHSFEQNNDGSLSSQSKFKYNKKLHIHKNRFLQDTNNNSTPQISKYILIIIIVFFVGVPAVATLIFIIFIIVKKCTDDPNEVDGQTTQNNDIQLQIRESEVNLSQYKVDQIGPYIINPSDQCVICLDSKANIRTFCGHFFHGACLRTWFKKKTVQRRLPTCPVCVSQTTNPIKIYCKKCCISGKLDKLSVYTSRAKTAQFDLFQCKQCIIQVGAQKSQNQQFDKSQQKYIQHAEFTKSAQKLYVQSQI